jgi:AcrR family transcriptional regulator
VAEQPLDPAVSPDPRIERTRAHVLSHARELLSAGGPAAVTYTALAARARVTRQTLYRHWPTREALIIDLVLENAAPGLPDGSGSPEHIVGSFLRGLRSGMQDAFNATAVTALVAQADHDSTSNTVLGSVIADRRAALNRLLQPSGTSVNASQYASLCGPVLFQRFFARETTSDQLIDHLVKTWSESR